MNLTDEQTAKYRKKLGEVAKESNTEIVFWVMHGFDDGTTISIKSNNKIVLKETRRDFTFEGYMDFINKAESVIMPKCP